MLFRLAFFLFFIVSPLQSWASDPLSSSEGVNAVEFFEFDSAQQQRMATELAKSLRCPQCQNQNLIESNSPIAKDLRFKVFVMVKEGKSEQEIVDYMVERFGDFVLYQPPFKAQTWLLWLAPIIILSLFLIYAARSVRRK
ncbi:heme lyase NrfEFG subunit NrfF [Vibrio metoecus]|uniref:Formate-dependent nitrite reductase complex subunit n=1 Tax=Vibrio metoecus TaxID=1481663 RepID=A0A271VW90_VIBMT|nr:heme lyase NrfEFG subunit NrfF [Vibrio metoecus]PAR22266.1 heme lyase NrfEFG subunit NrfF [Vibrio metoecus]PAR25123.1 heme lyase NrfEFG subunit NrfF [Vibrio metoecus]PAR39591.1 heme lyase NrfEFG subunit NrfF [Vibrio metoecus]PAR45286.1 heme lyase NrfEFG subunit NrfF [Vibrio metoecus]